MAGVAQKAQCFYLDCMFIWGLGGAPTVPHGTSLLALGDGPSAGAQQRPLAAFS